MKITEIIIWELFFSMNSLIKNVEDNLLVYIVSSNMVDIDDEEEDWTELNIIGIDKEIFDFAQNCKLFLSINKNRIVSICIYVIHQIHIRIENSEVPI